MRKVKPKEKPEAKNVKKDKILFFIAGLFAFLLYVNTIPNKYSLDDNIVINDDVNVKKGISGIPAIFSSPYREKAQNTYGYRPIAKSTFAIEYSLFGLNPHISHFINILLYTIAILLLFKLLILIFNNLNTFFLFCVVLIFAAHPIHTEVVASLKNREELLCFIFAILATISFFRFFQIRKWFLFLLGIFYFILAILSKQSALAFAFLIPFTIYFFNLEYKFSIKKISFGFLKNYLLMGGLVFLIIALLTNYKLSFISLAFFVAYGVKKYFEKIFVIKNWYIISGLIIFVFSFFLRQINFGFLNYKYADFFLACSVIIPFLGYIVSHFSKHFLVLFCFVLFLLAVGYFVNILPEKVIFSSDKKLFYFENPLFLFTSFSAKISLTIASFWNYLRLLVFPHPLSFYYGYNTIPIASLFSVKIIIASVIHLGLLLFSIFTFKKRQILSYAILFYFGSLILFSNIVMPVPGIIAERLTFIASVGFSIALGYLIFKISGASFLSIENKKVKPVFYVLLFAILIPYSAKTISRNTDWKSNISLYAADIDHLKNSAKANALYADELMRLTYVATEKTKNISKYKDTINLALIHYKNALEIYPDYPSVNNNIGTIYFNFYKDYSLAISYFNHAYFADSENTENIFNLAMAYEALGNKDSALFYYNKYCIYDSTNLEIINKAVNLNFATDNFRVAVSLNNKIKRIDPKSDLPYINLGNYLLTKGDTIAAVSQWEKAIEVYPDNYNLCMNLYLYYKSIRKSQKMEFYLQKAQICTQKEK